jgi:hypothetical protein
LDPCSSAKRIDTILNFWFFFFSRAYSTTGRGTKATTLFPDSLELVDIGNYFVNIVLDQLGSPTIHKNTIRLLLSSDCIINKPSRNYRRTKDKNEAWTLYASGSLEYPSGTGTGQGVLDDLPDGR